MVTVDATPRHAREVLHTPRRVLLGLVALVVVWLAVGAVGGPLTGKLAEVQKNDNASFLPAEAEATRALDLQARFQQADVSPALVIYERAGGITAEDRAAVAADLAEIANLPGLAGRPSPPIPSEDGAALQVFVPLSGADGDAILAAVERMRQLIGDTPGLTAHVSGPSGILADFIEVFGAIDTTLLLVTAVVVALILLVVYRSPVLWLLPLISAGLALSAAVAVIYLLARNEVLTLNGQSQGILFVLVFGAGTDYALLLISRYREELRRHRRPAEAMLVALRAAGPAIVASGATVILGLLCLLFSDLNSNRSLGPVSAIGIAAAMAVMLTFLPAVLALLGRFVFWPFVPHYGSPSHEQTGIWGRIARLVGRRSRASWVITGGLLAVLALGMTQLRAEGIAQTDAFTSEVDSVRGQQAIARHYPAGTGSPAAVIGRADAADSLLDAARVEGVADARLLSDAPPPGTPGAAGSPAPKVVDGLVQLDVTLRDPADSAAAEQTVRRLRTAVHAVPGAQAVVGGFTAIDLDVQDASRRDRSLIIPLVLAVIFVILTLLLRSLVAPVLLIGTVVLSFAATLGACALVFNNVFGFAGADTSFPLFAFVFLVALGIDYNIFLMTRVREESRQSGTRPGTLKGLAVTGGVITSAGVVLAATFSVLGVLPLVFLAELGFAVAFGVLLDALLVRSILVPALTYDVGRRVWWPSRLRADERNGS